VRVEPLFRNLPKTKINKSAREILQQLLQKGAIVIEMTFGTSFAVDLTSSKQTNLPSSSGAPLLLKTPIDAHYLSLNL
jgi:hypothetical protein